MRIYRRGGLLPELSSDPELGSHRPSNWKRKWMVQVMEASYLNVNISSERKKESAFVRL